MKNKFRVFLSLEKEEKWLNKELRKGWKLVGGKLTYNFEATRVDNQAIRLDYRDFKSQRNFEDYIQFMTDNGWEHLCGSKNSGKQYFIGSKTQDTELFSDNESRVELEKRHRNGLLTTLAVILIIYFIFYLNNIIDLSVLTDPKAIFYTPGLWDKSGSNFLFSFLFELPFALLRLVAYVGFPIITVTCIILTIQRQLMIRRYEKGRIQ